jgi:hypothetical protein
LECGSKAERDAALDWRVFLNPGPYSLTRHTMWIKPEMNVFDSRYQGKPIWTEKTELAYSAYFHTFQSNVYRVLPGFAQ